MQILESCRPSTFCWNRGKYLYKDLNWGQVIIIIQNINISRLNCLRKNISHEKA